MLTCNVVLVFVLYFAACLCATPNLSGCEVAAKTEQGFVCGRRRLATNRAPYASFRGIPYAKQPLGALRFKELQPAEPFDGVFNATEAGPICAQVDVFYSPIGLVTPRSSGEDCIRINVHVPAKFLPNPKSKTVNRKLLPIMFWIHGGAFSYGSGDADVHGPEYLMTKNCILVTCNYRLHALGFLSLDNEYIPGNNGLRDIITALKWVQRNIKNFGGDPARVTVAGQSAGGVLTHILSISPAAKGLFHQVIGLSGLSIANFYSYSKVYSDYIKNSFFTAIGINPFQTPKQIYDQLVATPLEKILHGNKVLLDSFGILTFAPVIESPQPNFTTVLPKDPEKLLNDGAGKEYPMIIGFCSNEDIVLKQRLQDVNVEAKMKLFPTLTLPTNLLFESKVSAIPLMTMKHLEEYFNVTFITLDKIIVSSTDSAYKYPAQRLTQKRLSTGAANTYVYQFGYPGEKSPMKLALKTTYPGAGHVEDMQYFFRFNGFLGPQNGSSELEHTSKDNSMKDWMTNFISNFIITGSPVQNDSDWPPTQDSLKFQNIVVPQSYNFTNLTPYMKDKLKYYTDLYKIGLGH